MVVDLDASSYRLLRPVLRYAEYWYDLLEEGKHYVGIGEDTALADLQRVHALKLGDRRNSPDGAIGATGSIQDIQAKLRMLILLLCFICLGLEDSHVPTFWLLL